MGIFNNDEDTTDSTVLLPHIEQAPTDAEILTDHTDVIYSTSVEPIVTGRNAALTQIETQIHQLNDITEVSVAKRLWTGL
ncbi:DUF957 domain-containing protein [Citrobacter freundii]|nr:DUF957 domain-containing protein [Citrobacter freundii]